MAYRYFGDIEWVSLKQNKEPEKFLYRHIQYISRKTREDLVYTENLNWNIWKNKAYTFLSKRKDARIAGRVILGVPNTLTIEQIVNLIREFFKNEVKSEFVGFAVHRNIGEVSDEINTHVHVVFSPMSLEGKKLDPKKQDLSRWHKKFDEYVERYANEKITEYVIPRKRYAMEYVKSSSAYYDSEVVSLIKDISVFNNRVRQVMELEKKQLEKQKEQLRKDAIELQKEEKELTLLKAELMNKKMRYQTLSKSTAMDWEEYEKEKEELEKKKLELEKKKQAIEWEKQQTYKELKYLNEEVEKLEQLQKWIEEQRQKQKKEYEEIKRQEEELEKEKEEIRKKKKLIEEQKEFIKKLEEQKEQEKELIKQNQELERKRQELERKRQEQEHQKKEVEQEWKKIQEKKAILNEEKKEITKEKGSIFVELVRLNERYKLYKSIDINKMEQRLNNLKKQIEQNKMTIEELSIKVEENEKVIQTMRQQIQEYKQGMKDRHEKLHSRLEKASQRVSEIEKELSEQAYKIDSLDYNKLYKLREEKLDMINKIKVYLHEKEAFLFKYQEEKDEEAYEILKKELELWEYIMIKLDNFVRLIEISMNNLGKNMDTFRNNNDNLQIDDNNFDDNLGGNTYGY